MSNNSHIMAVSIADFVFNPDYWIESPGLAWCGESFETGYVFREQLDSVLGPRMAPELRSVLNDRVDEITHPTLDQLRANEDGAVVIPLTAQRYAEFRGVVALALAEADWSTHDTYEWDSLVAAETVGDYYVIIEFE